MTDPLSVDEIMRRIRRRNRLLDNETYAAIALALATIAALLWANAGTSYEAFWHTPAAISLGDLSIELDLHGWIDEGLMAFFFFMVGLDVRREFALGDLRLPGRALLPVAAAMGGLVVPALAYVAIAGGTDAAHGWGAVISTDTAFALGALALIGPRNAPRVRLFVLALAVVDDVGALTVIGLLYTDDLNVVALMVAGALLCGIWLLQRRAVWKVLPYAILGVLTWYAVYLSGVHATLAGVLIALVMPVRAVRNMDLDYATEFFHLFRQAPTPRMALVARDSLVYAIPLNQRLSAILPPYVNYLVVPLFALANAGVVLSAETVDAALGSAVTWGIVAGLVVGKLVGITAVAMIVLRFVPSARLPGLDLPRIVGVGALCGMGFTISLLVVNLAFDDPAVEEQARMGVLAASVIALMLAAAMFKLGDRFAPLSPPEGDILQRPVDVARDHVFGELGAPISVVVYAGLNHAYRTRMEEALREAYLLVDQQLVRFVYRHRIESDQDMIAALALEAAFAQGRFWEMHDGLVREAGDIDGSTTRAVAARIGLDVAAFDARVASGEDTARILDDDLDVQAIESEGDPIVYMDRHRIAGPINRFRLTDAIGSAIDDLGSSPDAPADDAALIEPIEDAEPIDTADGRDPDDPDPEAETQAKGP